jgi:DNA-damage-inducible protein D
MSTLVSPALPANGSGDTSPFDAIRLVDNDGEYWHGRDLMKVMTYAAWRDFANAIDRAKIACRNSGHDVTSNFAPTRRISGTKPADDYRLSRYACYLTAMEADPNKTAVANAKTYFAVQTRKAETAATPKVLTDAEQALLLARALVDADARREIAESRADIEHTARVIAEQERDELTPAAESWDRLVNATGDRAVREAAQVLARDPEIKRMKIGQTKLFELLRDLGWLDKKSMPYQVHVNNGRLVLRMREWTDRDTKETHTSYQVRVTAKGIHDLRGHLTGAKPLQLKLALVGDGLPEETA